MNSAQHVLNGLNPGPMTELDFWSSRASDLELIVYQVYYYICRMCNECSVYMGGTYMQKSLFLRIRFGL